MEKRKLFENITDNQERAFYSSHNASFNNITIAGPADGESAFKESSDIDIKNSHFELRYPFWRNKNVTVRNSTIIGEYLAWYSENLTLINCHITSIKNPLVAQLEVEENPHLIVDENDRSHGRFKIIQK